VTWEALGTIVVTLLAFAVIVSGLAKLVWARLDRSDRKRRGDIRLSEVFDGPSRS
jgi:hypothetical protein